MRYKCRAGHIPSEDGVSSRSACRCGFAFTNVSDFHVVLLMMRFLFSPRPMRGLDMFGKTYMLLTKP